MRATAALGCAAVLWASALAARVDGRQEHRHHAPPQARVLASPLDLTDTDLAAGQTTSAARCVGCHGPLGKGGVAPAELGLSGKEQDLLARLRAEPLYPAMFAAAFPGDAAPISLANVTRAIASFERTLLSGRSPYDLYRTSADPRALSPAAMRGEEIFFSERTQCFHCHGGFNFTETADYVGKGVVAIEFHNTGLYNLDARGSYPVPNTGVHEVTRAPDDMGRFKAPSLRNIALTAPYMHDGSIATLTDVIRHYEAGGRTVTGGPHRGVGARNVHKSEFVKGFTVTDEERRDLVAFLESLTDLAFTSDPRFSDPWPPAVLTPAKGK